MVKKKVFVCYDQNNDQQYKHMLEEWNTNPDFEFCFNNLSLNEVKKDESTLKSSGRLLVN